MEAFLEYDAYDATGLAALVRDGRVHPSELVEAAADRLEQADPHINAVVYPDVDAARRAAKEETPAGPFGGVPFLVKDLGAACAGLPYTQSSRSRRGYVAAADNEIVARFRAAGLLILGKTSTPEFGLAPVTEPELHGPCRNPWDLGRSPAGSSGGSAAAVAAGIVPMAHGNDGGGSIRMPASACGLFGLKPSRGRSTWGPEYAYGWLGLSEQLGLSRTVRDSAGLLDATLGASGGSTSRPLPPDRPFAQEVGADPGRLRIAYTTGALLDPDPIERDCIVAVENAAALCESLGHEVDETLPDLDLGRLRDVFVTLAGAEAEFQVNESERMTGNKVRAGDVELVTWIASMIGRARTSGDLYDALHFAADAGRRIGEFMTGYDVILTSTMARPPWPIGDLDLAARDRLTLQMVRRAPLGFALDMVERQLAGEILKPMPNTPLFNMTGQPAMSVPLHWNDQNLPVGVQFAGRWGDEATLFRLASQLEAARPWKDRRPPPLD